MKKDDFTQTLKTIKDFKIACILDDFSYECFKYEADFIQLEPETWKISIDQEKPDLLFIESAWEGKKQKWRNKFFSYSQELGGPIYKLVSYCREKGIATVFWNKEDPVHFPKFVAAAKLFDYVFTTDIKSIPRYKTKLGHDRIYVLPFAAQPRLHNPLGREKERLGQAAFAGTWYMHHAERRVKLSMLLDAAAKYKLDIYDRKYRVPPISHFQYPAQYQPFIRGYLTYEEMVEAYKKYDVFLNVDSVADSPTMFSRRVFELLACGTPLVSAYSAGINEFFPEIVLQCKNKEEAASNLKKIIADRDFRDRLSVLGQREVFNKHSCRHRMQRILDTIGIKYKKDISAVSIISICRHFQNLQTIVANYDRQSYPHKELIILSDCSRNELERWQKESSKYSGLKLLHANKADNLPACLYKGLEQSSFEYISIFNEHDYYAPDYLGDLMHCFLYTDADIVGKSSYYSYQDFKKTLQLNNAGNEYTYVNALYYSAAIIRREVFKRISPGERLDFDQHNIKIYSADRFNYLHRESKKINAKEIKQFTTQEECIEYITV